jgi:uncharacterized membrane protein YraQ (UPF0718 family)/copper chaperone CopZ
MTPFFVSMWNVLLELAPWLLLGTAVASGIHVFLPEDFLKRQFSGSAGVLKAVSLGVPLPLCSCGVIPVGLGMKTSGANDGAVVGFLISTPQTGVDSILVSASFLGWPFAIFKLLSAAIMGLLGGGLTNWLGDKADPATAVSQDGQHLRNPIRIAEFFSYSEMLLHSLWAWLLLGIVASAAIGTWIPLDAFQGLATYGGLAAMFVTLLIAIPLYVCATASVPIAAALVASGMPTGAVLVFLMAGPATNVATIGAVYRTLGRRPLVIYLATVILGSMLCGWAFDTVLDHGETALSHNHQVNTWWGVASAVCLLLLMGRFLLQDMLRWKNRRLLSSSHMQSHHQGPVISMGVEGMTCQGCVAKLEKTLSADSQVESATVQLRPGRVDIRGDIDPERARKLVQQAGFQAKH